MLFAQEHAAVVQALLREGADEEDDADQQQWQVVAEARIGHVETKAAEGGVITQPVAEREAAEGHEGVAEQQHAGQGGFTQGILGGAGHRAQGGVTVSSSSVSSSGEGSQPLLGSAKGTDSGKRGSSRT